MTTKRRPKEAKPNRDGEATCVSCGIVFVFDVAKARTAGVRPDNCGVFVCRSKEFTDDEWAGMKRMAAARKAAKVPLTALDRKALRRASS